MASSADYAPLPHRFPKDAPAEVIAWECAACGEWLDEGAARHSSCTVDWRRHNDGRDDADAG